MKKTILFLLAVLLCFSISGCKNNPSPSEVTDSYLKALKANDSTAISKLYLGESDLNQFISDSGVETESYSKEFLSAMQEKMLAFEYTLSNETIQENTATVDIAVKTYNVKDAFKAGIGEYFQQALSMIFSGVSDEEMEALAEELLSKHLSEATFDYEKNAVIHLSKIEGEWKVDDIKDNTDLTNALSGGLLEFAADMKNAFSN